MKAIIIEDERITATDLQLTLQQIDPALEILSIIRSVRAGKDYFSQGERPDVIFSDIQLGDGLSFEILDGLDIPVIFCTAYDEYALEAFRANGIGYILKPFTEDSVQEALHRYYRMLRANHAEVARQYEALAKLFTKDHPKVSSLLVNHKDRVLPVRIVDIALFFLKNNLVHLETFDGRTLYPNKSLDELESMVGDGFFRINRQYLVNRAAVKHASSLLSRKMSVAISIPHDDPITISRERSPLFLKWLQKIV